MELRQEKDFLFIVIYQEFKVIIWFFDEEMKF